MMVTTMRRTEVSKGIHARGFTIAETLIVVAILAVCAGLAIPKIYQSWKDYRMTDLDGTAHEIFQTAQNDLTQKKASGQLAALMDDSTILHTETVSADGEATTLYYINSEQLDSSMEQLDGFMSTLSGSCILYLNPRSGDVTDVYYAKDALSHDTVADLRARLGDHDDADVRANLGIGYYGGLSAASAEPSEESGSHSAETLELINGEDLYVKLVYPDLGESFSNPDKVLAEITIADERGNTVTVRANGLSAADANTPAVSVYAGTGTNDDYTLYVLLDSLTDGCSFSQMFPTLTAGDNITVTASLFYDGQAIYKNAPVGTTNSLFAAKYSANVTVGGIAHRAGIEIARVRQLSNLRYYRMPGSSVVQTADIDFTLSVRQQTMLPAQTHLDAAPQTFTPVSLTDSAVQSGLIIDGQDGAGAVHTLSNFQIRASSAGLFGDCTVSITMQNLRLIDCTVTGTAQAGALAGSVQSTGGAVLIQNCGVYQTAAGAGAVAIAGSAGMNTPAGGLIGSVQVQNANSIAISDCFAAVDVTNTGNQTGGLIGKISGGSSVAVTLQNSYASGGVKSGTSGGQTTAGGLAGASFGKVAFSDCFSSSDVAAASGVGALVGANTGTLSISSGYSCGIVTTGGAATYGPLVAGSGSVSYADCQYLSQSGNTAVTDAYASSAVPAGVSACEYSALRVDSGGKTISNETSACHPYTSALSGKAYPFRMATAEYFGDWPSEIVQAVANAYGLCYYEEYSDSSGTISWGFYGYDASGAIVNTLDNVNAETIIATGYGVVVPSGTTSVSAPNIGWGNDAVFGSMVTVSQTGQYLYPLPNAASELMTHDNQLNRSVTDKQTGRTIYMNPLFAAALSTSPLTASESQPIQIRTEAQLRARGKISDSGWYFEQTHDVYITKADTGNYYNNVGCTYDGAGNTIYNLQQPLFGTNLNIIRSLSLSNVFINQSSNTAALVLTNQGTVSDCHVISGGIASTSGSAAGLIQSNAAAVSNCSVSAQVSTSSGSAAGLVSTNTWGGSITNCSVSGKVTASGGGASGFVYTNGGGSIQLSYSTASVMVGNSANASGMIDTFSAGSVSSGYWSGTLSSNSGAASGFCRSFTAGTASNCFAVGTVTTASGTATGFAKEITQYGGTVTNSYAAVKLQVTGSGSRLGFTGSPVCCTGSYWIRQSGFNEGVADTANSSDRVTAISFTQLSALNTLATGWSWNSGSGSWTLTTSSAQTHPASSALNGKPYPYPRIAGLDFYGDWPTS